MKKTKKRILLENFYSILVLGYIPILIIEYLITGEFIAEGIKYRYIETTFIFLLFCSRDLLCSKYNLGKVKILTKDDDSPKKHLLIFRNIFVLNWPLDVIPLFLFNKRLGDIVFRTKTEIKI